jgi:glycosyltransferase involved in cell wall biosynthesis
MIISRTGEETGTGGPSVARSVGGTKDSAATEPQPSNPHNAPSGSNSSRQSASGAPSLDDYRWLAERREVEVSQHGEFPLVSVITATWNAAETLERTIASVQSQTYPAVEHVIVDGGSTDGTIDVLKERLRPHDFWISEKDDGISDAFNRGIALARGYYLQIMSADDWLSVDQLACAVDASSRTGADFVFGDCICYEGGRPMFRSTGDADYSLSIASRMPMMNHPSMLVRRSAYERFGLYSLKYRNAMDYEWLARVHCAGGYGTYDPRIVAHVGYEGRSIRLFKLSIRETRDIAVTYGRNPLVAELEYRFRVLKTTLSQPVKRSCRPLYDAIRSTINPFYRALR